MTRECTDVDKCPNRHMNVFFDGRQLPYDRTKLMTEGPYGAVL